MIVLSLIVRNMKGMVGFQKILGKGKGKKSDKIFSFVWICMRILKMKTNKKFILYFFPFRNFKKFLLFHNL